MSGTVTKLRPADAEELLGMVEELGRRVDYLTRVAEQHEGKLVRNATDAVYAGRLNYRAGEWRDECCQVMRHSYDLDAYMAEEGYVRVTDPTVPNGFRWETTP